MRTKLLIMSFIFVGLMACNSGVAPEPETEETEMTHEDHGSSEGQLGEMDEVSPDARVFFVNLKDGQTVSSPVHIEMGVEGIEIHPAGEVIEGTGHHHILVNQGTSYPFGEVIPADDVHIHFGAGQTETDLELEPGEYTITMQFADGAHRSYGEQLAASVTVIVE